MTSVGLASLVEGFFTKRLIAQLRASAHTIASYRDTFRLLLRFAKKRLKRPPSKLTLADLNAPFVASFLDELESERATAPAVATCAWPGSGRSSVTRPWKHLNIRR